MKGKKEVMVAFLIAFLAFLLCPVSALACHTYVPNVVGMSLAEAECVLGSKHLCVGVVTPDCDLDPAQVCVIGQDPAAGTYVAYPSDVDLTVFCGPCGFVEVPCVVGMVEADARNEITSAGLEVGEITYGCSDTVPEGEVISQDPLCGTLVAGGTAVDLLISTGFCSPCPVGETQAPEVLNMTQAEAEAAIVAAGLTVGTITTQCNDQIPAGDVISASPVGGTCVAIGSSIDLLISSGLCTVEVPCVEGELEADARSDIENAELVVGNVDYECSDSGVPAGVVISQFPDCGTMVAPGSAVNLLVSTGPCDVEVPCVEGEPEADARSDIENAGLVVGIVDYECSNSVDEGRVISQNPICETLVAPGSAVDLLVSTGPCDVVVPDVVGELEADAGTMITSALLTVGVIDYAPSGTVPAGHVISQNPVGGTLAPIGSAVDLLVSTGCPDTDGDRLTDCEEIPYPDGYGTDPNDPDTDHDGINDGDEALDFWPSWGSSWDADCDEDGVYNLLDYDSDWDMLSDGEELALGSDPCDLNDPCPVESDMDEVVYSDAEDSTTDGWSVFDNSPTGAAVSNVEDLDPGHDGTRAIEFSGYGTLNAFTLRNIDGSPWDNPSFEFGFKWSMKYSEFFQIFIEVRTTKGTVFLYYTPVDNSTLANWNKTYVHHGLGSDVIDGQWHKFRRDLQMDLEEGIPGESVLALNAFYIRGNGRVDDVSVLSPVTALSINDVSIQEEVDPADRFAVFTISTNRTSCFDISVDYRTSNGTAIGGRDYEITEGTATVPRGETEVQVAIPIIDDSDVEGPQNFFVQLRNARYAWISDDTGEATITSDDWIYEDAEDGATYRWMRYASTSGTIDNVYDEERGSRVIELSDSGTASAYVLRNEDQTLWHNSNSDRFLIEFSIRTTGFFYFYVDVETTAGQRLLFYTPEDGDKLNIKSKTPGLYVHHGLGSDVMDDQWHTFTRSLPFDLNEAQPGVNILEVNEIFVRGNLRIDDVKALEMVPILAISDVTVNEDAGVAIFTITGTEAATSDVTVDFTTIDDTAVAGSDFVFTAGTATILAGTDSTDIMVDIIDDGDNENNERFFVEISNPHNALISDNIGVGTIPANDCPPATVYEDAEDGNTTGWSVFDNTPAGATISNVEDLDPGHSGTRAIQLTGSGTSNAYELNNWSNTTQFVIEWSMKYSENFYVFVELNTSAGLRYVYYTPSYTSGGGTGTYVHRGLGTDAANGTWHTFRRDLQLDLAQAGVTIQQVNRIFIRGSGRVDDIELRECMWD